MHSPESGHRYCSEWHDPVILTVLSSRPTLAKDVVVVVAGSVVVTVVVLTVVVVVVVLVVLTVLVPLTRCFRGFSTIF
jgi:hypothetical protein